MMEKKMMITGEVIKKPEHIELGKYNVTVRTKGGKELTVQIDSEGIDERLEVGMTAAFTATMVDDIIVADKVSYSRKG
ncbi:MAG: hypothetical protein ACI4Q6_01345, partial [Huintestinicola sp.]